MRGSIHMQMRNDENLEIKLRKLYTGYYDKRFKLTINNNMKNTIFFILVAGLIGCLPMPVEQNPVGLDPCPDQECDTMVVWKERWPDSLLYVTTLGTTLLSNDRVLYSTRRPGHQMEVVRMINGITKELIWEWSDYLPNRTPGFQHSELIGEDFLYLNSTHEHYGIDLNTGETLWSNIEKRENILTTQFGDKIFYSTRRYGNCQYSDSTVLYMADIHDGIWQPIFYSLKDHDTKYDSSLCPPSGYIEANGDTLLVFQDRRGRISPPPRHDTELICYNLTQKKVKWRAQHLAPTDVSNMVNPPVIDEINNRVYFLTLFTVFCFSLETGEELWKVKVDNAGMVSSNYILSSGKLITITDQGYLIGFDAYTGERLYYNRISYCCVMNLKVLGDRIYLTDPRLIVADVNTGQLKWKYGSRSFRGGVGVSEESDVMYGVGNYYFYAIKKPLY